MSPNISIVGAMLIAGAKMMTFPFLWQHIPWCGHIRETGRKALYINRTFTTRINELTAEESDAVLAFLFSHIEHVNYQIRYRWSLNDMAFWDNRCCMHRAIWDYWPEERKGRRVTVKGDIPA